MLHSGVLPAVATLHHLGETGPPPNPGAKLVISGDEDSLVDPEEESRSPEAWD